MNDNKFCVFENLDEFDILHQVGEFYLARHMKGDIMVVYAYDGGYTYDAAKLDDLMNIDTDKLIEQWMNAIGKMVTAQRPYSNKFSFGGDEDEIL